MGNQGEGGYVKFKFCALVIVSNCWNRIGEENVLAFNKWSTGEENFLVVQFVPLWNKLHGDVFFINEDRWERECSDAIIRIWEGEL